LANLLGATLEGDADRRIRRPVPAGEDDDEGLTFAEADPYLSRAAGSQVAAILVPPDTPMPGQNLLRVPSPRAVFARFLALCRRPAPTALGVHPSAVVHASAKVEPGAAVGALSVIEEEAVVQADACVMPLAYIGPRCRVGPRCVIFPHAVLVADVTLGSDVTIHPGVVLGADGFGFVWDGRAQTKIPQVGRVEIGDGVEIGANTTVDRATAGATRVAPGVKLDNLVQIGHNVQIGAHSVVAALAGISGSTVIGQRVTIAGQVGTAAQAQITDDVMVAGKTGVTSDITEPGAYMGMPHRPAGEMRRIYAAQSKLPELLKRIRQLEKRLEELER
jgi:UDP-3-O-[3-hydroxymyristoyl] glucosamine N-acyltransferase